jgi:hypothetical protein
MSKSSGKVWLRPLSVTVTLVTVSVKPATLMVDGYGDAGPLDIPGAPAGIRMGAGLLKVWQALGVGVGVGVLVGVGVGGNGVGVAVGVVVGVGVGVATLHLTLIKAEWN